MVESKIISSLKCRFCAAGIAVFFVAIVALAQSNVETSIDRAFGYMVGDVITIRHTLPLPTNVRIDPESLPPLGRDGGWFELLKREVNGNQITLHYQVTNSPKAVRVVFTPKSTLRGSGATPSPEFALSAVPISLSPLSGAEAFDRAGMEAMRPDRAAPQRETRSALVRMLLWAALTMLGVIYLAHLRFGPYWGARGLPFAATRAVVRKHVRHGETREAIRALHRAIDRTASRAVLSADLDAFLRDHPEFCGAREDLQRFFTLSQNAFFADEATAATDATQWLTAFSERMAQSEARA